MSPLSSSLFSLTPFHACHHVSPTPSPPWLLPPHLSPPGSRALCRTENRLLVCCVCDGGGDS